MDLKELGLIDPNNHWYYKHKAHMLISLYEKFKKESDVIIEIGAGSGFFCNKFFKEFNFIGGYCVDPFYEDSQLDKSSAIKFQRNLPSVQADLYLYIDVLEHVDNPVALLEETVINAKKDSIFIISVPAFSFLWSEHDVFLEHKKRYTLQEIKNVCLDVNLSILQERYIFAPIFPLVYLARKLPFRKSKKSDMREFSPIINTILERILRLESGIKLNKLFGTSAIILAKKVN